jgi:hypothetical protein
MQELISLLMQRLNVDGGQAAGGAGILFRAAKEKLGSSEFTSMLGSVPGLDSLVARAPQAKAGGLLGGIASFAGGNAAIVMGIVSGFSKLGLTSDHAQRFVPVILEYLRTQVGPDVVSKLEKTLRA